MYEDINNDYSKYYERFSEGIHFEINEIEAHNCMEEEKINNKKN